MRETSKKLERRLVEANGRIQELEGEVARREQETGFIRPRLAQAHRVFQSSKANFCSHCLSLCSSIDMLGCGHYLCFQCQVGNASCKLCNVKEDYGSFV